MTNPKHETRNTKLLLKLAIAIALIAYVLSKKLIDFQRLGSLFQSPTYIAIALLLLTAQLLVSALRTDRLLRAHDVIPGLWVIIKLTYLGAFFDTVSIASIGGDPVKAWYLAHSIPPGRRTEAVSALLVDRFFGLLGLLTLTVSAVAWRFDSLWSDHLFRPYVVGLLSVCAGIAIGAFLLFSKRVHDWPPLKWALGKLPFGETANRAYSSMQAYRGQPRILLEAWLLSLLVHTLSSLSGFVLALGLGMNETKSSGPIHFEISLFFAALLIGNFVSSFASFGAIGVGQAAFAFAFERVAHLSGGADLATAGQIAFFLAKTPGLLAWITARKACV